MSSRAANLIVSTTLLLAGQCSICALSSPTTQSLRPSSWQRSLQKAESSNKIYGPLSEVITSTYNWTSLIQVAPDNFPQGEVLFVCTGTLIGPHKVLTTAECCLDDRIDFVFDPQSDDPLENLDLAVKATVDITVGAHLLDEEGTMVFQSTEQRGGNYDGELRAATGFWVPNNYLENLLNERPERIRFDVCILQLQAWEGWRPIPAQPADLTTFEDPVVEPGTTGILLGWGAQALPDSTTEERKVTQLKAVPVTTKDCAELPGELDWTTAEWGDGRSIFICARKPADVGGGCVGDQGGPLFIEGKVRGIYLGPLHEPSIANTCTDPEDVEDDFDIYLDIGARKLARFLREYRDTRFGKYVHIQ